VSRALVVAAAVAALAVAGCGGGSKPAAGKLAWSGKPSVFRSHDLPHDRVVVARVRNVGKTTLHLVAAKLVVRDAGGKKLAGSAGFTTTFAHGLYGALEKPKAGVPTGELIRLGKIVYLPPGASVPFYAAWRLGPGDREPVTVDYGSGALDVPKPTGVTAR
jgi:hypothetical protein